MYSPLINQNRSDYLKWLLLLVLAALWGTSFILMKRGLEVFTPFQVAGLRIFVAFIFMIPVFFYVGRREAQWKDLKWFFLVGLVGNTIPPFLFCLAQLGISSSEAGIFNALTPLFTLIIGAMFFGYKTTRLKNAGIGLGLVGAVMLILLRYDLKMNMQLGLYPIFIILAAVLYGIGANNLKTRLSHIHPITTASMLYITTGYLGGLVLFHTDFFQTLYSHPRAYRAAGYVVVLGIFCTAVAMIVFNYLLRRTSVVFASTVTYLMPVVSLLWGVLDGEPVNIIHLTALGLILTGIYLTSR